MIRVAQGRSATLQHTFYSNGVPTDPSPDAATVGITRDDGTNVVAVGTAATEVGVGTVSYTLTPADTALLDILTVRWTGTFGGQPQVFTDIVEVVGGFIFSIAQARVVKPLDNTSTYTTDQIVETRTLVEEALEHACGVAFVPRYKRETLDGYPRTTLMLSQPYVTAIRSVSMDDTVFDAPTLASIKVARSGRLYYPSFGWAWGYSNIDIAYEHGYSTPPLRITQAALLLAKNWLVKGPIDDRTTAFSTEDGTYSLATPGMRGSLFGIPEVDQAVNEYNLQACIA